MIQLLYWYLKIRGMENKESLPRFTVGVHLTPDHLSKSKYLSNVII